MNVMRIVVVGTAFALSLSAVPSLAQDCEGGNFDSTFALIQKVVFENRGCTVSACHGAAASGGLDLRADVAHDNLIEQPATTVPAGTIAGLKRVVPGQKDQSLLYINLAAATLSGQWEAPLRAMPIGFEPLSLDELEAVREWIEQGAPREGTVPGTGELLDACLPPAKPIEIAPLPVPEAGVGVQIRMPRWTLPAGREDEVCFASYYDVTDQVPAQFVEGDSFVYKSYQIRQDPLSHHLITRVYDGDTAYDDPIWGEYKCRGGEKDGQACAPTDLGFCGPEVFCASEPQTSLACVGFGPDDARTATRGGIPGTQEASFSRHFPEGVFRSAPLKGLIVWNSHAFNLTDEDGKLEGWINFEFAQVDERVTPALGIFNTSSIFGMNVPPFEAQEICKHHVFPPDTRLYELNSHTHKRGKRFRVFDGRFVCDGGPNDGAACPPEGDEVSASVCAGSSCVALVPPESGDCNGDGEVGVSDLIGCVNIALDVAEYEECVPCDGDYDGRVSIGELVRVVGYALAQPEHVDASDRLLYTSLVYNDPTIRLFEPAREYPDRKASAAARTLTYCSFYDNGWSDPSEVKKQSTSPPPPNNTIGGPCAKASGCTEGLVGESCAGETEAELDASCDSSPGAGDGVCDACQLRGGVTTEDEMFILMGGFFIER